jgi:predicted lipoprotein with Yx(FWY)xxD motif
MGGPLWFAKEYERDGPHACRQAGGRKVKQRFKSAGRLLGAGIMAFALAAVALAFAGEGTRIGMADGDSTQSILLRSNSPLGPVLTNDQGLTLYVRTSDAVDPTGCVSVQACIDVWHPLQAPSDGSSVTSGPGVAALIGTVMQQSPAGQITQVTYNGRPLYRYSNDSRPGDVKGAGIGGIWLPAAP